MIAVSNTIEALLALPGVNGAVHHDTVSQWLPTGFPGDRMRTWYADVRSVLPGQLLCVSRDGAMTLGAPWRPPDAPTIRYRNARDYPAHFLDVLNEAVRARLRTDRTAIFMSGGLGFDPLPSLPSPNSPRRFPTTCVPNDFHPPRAPTQHTLSPSAARGSPPRV